MLQELRRDGYTAPFYRPSLAADLHSALMEAPTFMGHVIPQGDRVPRSFNDAMATKHGMACHHMASVLSVPGMFDNLAEFHTLAADYFQEEPFIYSVNAFWKKPKGAPGWHYDEDDRKQLVMFMYGTDVPTDDDGVHAYVTGSHLWDRPKLKPWHNVQEDVSGPLPADWPVHRFHGPAGTTFLTDTRGLHNGFPPVRAPRLLLWSRWGVSKPPVTYKNDELSPVPWRMVTKQKPNPVIQNRTQLVVNWT